jgi:hypothetical protein
MVKACASAAVRWVPHSSPKGAVCRMTSAFPHTARRAMLCGTRSRSDAADRVPLRGRAWFNRDLLHTGGRDL